MTASMGQRSRALLLGACVLLGGLLWFLGGFQRERGSSRGAGAAESRTLPSQGNAERAALPPISSDPDARVSVGSSASAAPPVEVAASTDASAAISGRILLDHAAPEGGRLWLCSADGAWERSAAIDYEGRFRIGGVPAAKLALTFELPPGVERQLLLPVVEVVPAAGATAELDLDWETRHVNLRVIGDSPAGNRARVEVEGPGIRASIETDEDGKARLSVVGKGSFSFRAAQPDGRQGTATLELEAGAGLDSVVIRVSIPR